MNISELIDKIFKDPKTKYELSEFDSLGKAADEILNIIIIDIQESIKRGLCRCYYR